jgi:hypothetical protein
MPLNRLYLPSGVHGITTQNTIYSESKSELLRRNTIWYYLVEFSQYSDWLRAG